MVLLDIITINYIIIITYITIFFFFSTIIATVINATEFCPTDVDTSNIILSCSKIPMYVY